MARQCRHWFVAVRNPATDEYETVRGPFRTKRLAEHNRAGHHVIMCLRAPAGKHYAVPLMYPGGTRRLQKKPTRAERAWHMAKIGKKTRFRRWDEE